MPLSEYTQAERDGMVIDHGDEYCISKIITDDLPDAVTEDMIREATKQDPVSQKLIACIMKGHISQDETLKPYRQVFHELTNFNNIILRGKKVLIPDYELVPGEGTLREQIVDIAHEGHQGTVKCKQYLRLHVWFPGIDKMAQEKTEGCEGCQATTLESRRDPIKPTVLPNEPW